MRPPLATLVPSDQRFAGQCRAGEPARLERAGGTDLSILVGDEPRSFPMLRTMGEGWLVV